MTDVVTAYTHRQAVNVVVKVVDNERSVEEGRMEMVKLGLGRRWHRATLGRLVKSACSYHCCCWLVVLQNMAQKLWTFYLAMLISSSLVHGYTLSWNYSQHRFVMAVDFIFRVDAGIWVLTVRRQVDGIDTVKSKRFLPGDCCGGSVDGAN